MARRLGRFEMPKRIVKDESDPSENYGRFIAEPLEAGYGRTIGNSLRRVLLSSLEGAAISSIKIDGALHEFGTLEGVVEDITDIICETDVSLTGGGVINMSDDINNRIYTNSNTLTLTNVDNTIRGSGKIGNNQAIIVNQGTILADQPTRLEIDPAAGGFNNQGSLIAENGAEAGHF